MISSPGSAEHLIDLIQGKAPDYLQLITATGADEFDFALEKLIANAINLLEQNSSNFSQLSETGLTAAFIMGLSIPGLLVTQEQHTNGHVDITVLDNYQHPSVRRLGEAKIYAGYEYHAKGLNQLVGRYMTGREGRGMMVFYHRGKNIAGAVKTLRQKMDDKLPEDQTGKTEDHVMKWTFTSRHDHSSGEELFVAHYGCNMYDPVNGGDPAITAKSEESKEVSDGNKD